MSSSKIAVHGHFYQPDRVNPFTGLIANDWGAITSTDGKYKNWNEVIFHQCYKPLADQGIFSKISFDLFRSLADWMEGYDNQTYKVIINQVQQAKQIYGIENVFASPWVHSILPLLSHHDLITNLTWGIADFEKRFGFKPSAFWLPETAINKTVAETLTALGIRLIILAPWQAREHINTNKLYRIQTESNQPLICAFFNRDMSQAVSFNNQIMQKPENFIEAVIQKTNVKQFGLIASDGERYGHHLRGGEKFLDTFFNSLIQEGYAITIPQVQAESSEFLQPVKIIEKSSWSCTHGNLQRWQGDCPCSYDEGHQMRVSGAWKAALSTAVNRLAHEQDAILQSFSAMLVIDCQKAVQDYVHVLLGNKTWAQFVKDHAAKRLSRAEEHIVKVLMTIQQHKLTTFTSCAFFFCDLDRPEPRIVIQHAKYTIELLRQIGREHDAERLENEFVAHIEHIKSHFSTVTGKDVYYEQ